MKYFLVSLLSFGLLNMAAASPIKPVLKVKSYLKIDSGEKIYLHQLIDTAGLSPAVSSEISRIALGSAPALGEQRIFTSKAIAQAARSVASLKSANLVIPNQVVVENRGYELSEEALSNELVGRWKTLCGDCDVVMKSIHVPILPAHLKDRPWILESDARLPRGTFASKLLVTQVNGTQSIFWVNGIMAVRKLVPVATRSLSFGQRLAEEDFRWEWREVTRATDGVPNEKSMVGQMLRLPVQMGDILFVGILEREKAVRRGEVVQVVTGEDAWEVTLDAVTEQDGYIGDMVNVRNRQSNKVVSAEVIARGKVAVQ